MMEMRLDWNESSKEVVARLEAILKKITDGTDYYVEINQKDQSKCVNIFKRNGEKRIAHLQPNKREQRIHVNITKELVDQLKKRMDLPKDSDIKEGRYPNWRAFKNTDFDIAMKIVEEMIKL